MNTLSWFVYFASVIPNLKHVGIALFIFVIPAMIFSLPPKGEKFFGRGHPHPGFGFTRTRTWVVAMIALLFVVFTPSSSTMYMIAASELGEVAVMNEEVREVFDALKDRILIELRPQENTNN